MASRRKFIKQVAGLSVVAAGGVATAALLSPGNASAEKKQADTRQNLMDAFAGESQANRMYLTFAEQAEKEGLSQAATLFRALAASETIHAMHHLRSAGKVGSTVENLKTARDGEVYESTKMYPEMAETAAAEGKKSDQQYFTWAAKVEADHAELYKKAIEANGKIDKVDYYLCAVCGYTHEGPYNDNCPVCAASKSEFFKFA